MKAIIGTRRPGQRHELGPAAFTLTELVVVIAMVALLFLLMVPAFSQTSSQAKSFQCLQNMHRLTAAWRMFANENSDNLVGNSEGISDPATWANHWVDWTTSTGNTNQAILRASPLAPYVNSDLTVFRCPADTYLSAIQRSVGWTSPRIRSVSMNAFVGSRGQNSNRNEWYSNYRQWLKLAEFPHPADYFVFTDEHPDSINGGLFLNNPSPGQGFWIDIPGSLHNGGANISFADEHVETHRWQSYSTKIPVIFNYVAPGSDSLGQSDNQWLRTRTAILFQ